MTAKTRILLVDDDTLLARSLARVLRPHDIVLAASLDEARQALRENPEFGLILCDLGLGDYSGADLHGDLQADWPQLVSRVVFMTGGAVNERDQAFLDQVPNERIDKPFDLNHLREIARRACS